ncbi:phosphonate metabolism transcriptional regulator PhnF [Bacillus sp. M6-12]|uniref:GntR family transcriptional regulator n=1 Tax=Bacillus sp. M6-12 TaxID=2054166 RepID=UPI000C78B4D8|nr:GntR family transcriptional regulator [Bacillus sp. M6-12]PLS17935.1 phosphonate metabolism transcriptional regulator PhnF [Bacillus sp. M6-12]
MIDKKSPIPIYHQLEELIRQQIEEGVLKEDTAIPSEREYADCYQISRMTVRQALTNLVNDGYLCRQKGKGTFVSKKKVEQTLHGLTSFSEEMLKKGMNPENVVLYFKKEPANKQIASILKLTELNKVLIIQRIRLADQLPMALETAYLPAELAGDITEEQAIGSFYSYIEKKLGLHIYEAKQEIEALAANEEEAQVLQIKPGSPVLKMTRISFLDDGTPFEYVKSTFRADRYRFTHTLQRN